ncbi:hypothetical protein [Hafnia alvei]|uniref:hypothetical protein n=1 Tax=Hafnia alvei TaxID=569 RepID=UPI0024A8E2BE|nr:hypothetical protein [Hafnia alvei]
MKISLTLCIAILALLISSFIWLITFHHYPVSEKTSDWSNFGSYIGGVAGPILSFISIILVIETIKQTQNNHKEQISLIIREQTYSKFQDLCNYLEHTLETSWIRDNSNIFIRIIDTIKTETIFERRFNENSNTANKHAIALEKGHFALNNFVYDIDNIILIIRTLNNFIFIRENSDIQLMTNMLELKLSKEERFLIFLLIKRDHPTDALLLNDNWPTFCVYPW